MQPLVLPPLLVTAPREVTLPPPLSLRQLGLSLAGLGAFGLTLRSAAGGASAIEHLTWPVLLPLTLVLSFMVTLPAFYLLWATRHEEVRLGHCLHAVARALITAAACLASTAPILWFF